VKLTTRASSRCRRRDPRGSVSWCRRTTAQLARSTRSTVRRRVGARRDRLPRISRRALNPQIRGASSIAACRARYSWRRAIIGRATFTALRRDRVEGRIRGIATIPGRSRRADAAGATARRLEIDANARHRRRCRRISVRSWGRERTLKCRLRRWKESNLRAILLQGADDIQRAGEHGRQCRACDLERVTKKSFAIIGIGIEREI